MVSATDVVARVLGVIGTVSGLVAATVALLAYLRDRARLVIQWRMEFGGDLRLLVLVVTNDGRRPVLLRDVDVRTWFVSDRRVRLARALRPLRRIPLVGRLRDSLVSSGGRRVTPDMPVAEPVLLDPADHASYTYELERLRDIAATSERLYACAETITGRSRCIPVPQDLVDYLRVPAEELERRSVELERRLIGDAEGGE